MTSCSTDDLIANARCFHHCITGHNEQSAIIYLLCIWAGGSPLQNPPAPQQVFAVRFDPQHATVGCTDFGPGDGISQVNVYRSFVLGGPYVQVGTFSPLVTDHYVDSTLTESDNAYYVLKSIGDGGIYASVLSDPSLEVCAIVAPSNLQVDVLGGTAADISWDYTAPNPVQGWQIQYGTDPTFAVVANDAVPTGVAPFSKHLPFPTQPPLTPFTLYYFRVRAIDPGTCLSPWANGSFNSGGPD